MKLLSIDVGIKNLAYCLFDINSSKSEILKWNVIDLSESEILNCDCIENSVKCIKPAKYKKNLLLYCNRHAKKTSYQIPKFKFDLNKLSRNSLLNLKQIASELQIFYNVYDSKSLLVEKIEKFIHDNYLQAIEKSNGNKVNIINIGRNIQAHFNSLLADVDTIEYLIIENQISPIANRMKCIQGMLVQYFIMCNIFVDKIEFISACNKLKDCNIPEKTKYSDRKKMSINKCLEIIECENSSFLNFFLDHKKKDDLSDCFLQGKWFIKEKINNI